MNVLFWILFAFTAGSVPWAVWLGNTFLKTDIRTFGDKNPGGVNAWKAGGWRLGSVVIFLDFSKGAVPVLLALGYGGLESWSLTLVALAPILGHAYSPLLSLRGGKALAVSLGVWTGLSLGLLFPVILLFLAVFYSIQRTDAWTILLTALGLLGFLAYRSAEPFELALWAGNTAIIILKHHSDLRHGVVFRTWALRILGRVI